MSYYLIQQIGQRQDHGTEHGRACGRRRRPPASDCLANTDRRAEKSAAAGCSSSSAPQPRTDWLDGVVARDDHGFILTGPTCATCAAGRWTDRRTIGNKCAGCVRCRRCACRLRQTGGRRGRRRLDGRDVGAPVSGGGEGERPWARTACMTSSEPCSCSKRSPTSNSDAVRQRPHRGLRARSHLHRRRTGHLLLRDAGRRTGDVQALRRRRHLNRRTSQRGVYCGAWSAYARARNTSTRRRYG